MIDDILSRHSGKFWQSCAHWTDLGSSEYIRCDQAWTICLGNISSIINIGYFGGKYIGLISYWLLLVVLYIDDVSYWLVLVVIILLMCCIGWVLSDWKNIIYVLVTPKVVSSNSNFLIWFWANSVNPKPTKIYMGS